MDFSNKDLKKSVHDFLNKRRAEDNLNYTHLSYGKFNGKFSISKQDHKEFIKLYIDAVNNGVNDFSILEKQGEFSRVIVDVDLIKSDVNNKRLYNEKLIKKVSKYYIKSIKKYLNVNDEDLNINVFEKESATEKQDNKYKDGFHLICPNIVTNIKTRTNIYNNVLKLCVKNNIFDEFENKEKALDEAIIFKNSWFLYGSKKPDGQTYKLTKIYNNDLDELEFNYNDSEIIKNMSLFKISEKHQKEIKEDNEEFNNEIVTTDINNIDVKEYEKFKRAQQIKIFKKQIKTEKSEQLTNELIINKSTSNKHKTVNIILQNLNEERFNNFND